MLKSYTLVVALLALISTTSYTQDSKLRVNIFNFGSTEEEKVIDLSSIEDSSNPDINLNFSPVLNTNIKRIFVNANFDKKINSKWISLGIGLDYSKSETFDVDNDSNGRTEDKFEFERKYLYVNFGIYEELKLHKKLVLYVGVSLLSQIRFKSTVNYNYDEYNVDLEYQRGYSNLREDSNIFRSGPSLNMSLDYFLFKNISVGISNTFWVNYTTGPDYENEQSIFFGQEGIIERQISFRTEITRKEWRSQNNLTFQIQYYF